MGPTGILSGDVGGAVIDGYILVVGEKVVRSDGADGGGVGVVAMAMVKPMIEQRTHVMEQMQVTLTRQQCQWE